VNQTEYRVHGVRVERLMPLTPLHVLYFDAEMQKTDTINLAAVCRKVSSQKNKSTTDHAHFLSEGPLPA